VIDSHSPVCWLYHSCISGISGRSNQIALLLMAPCCFCSYVCCLCSIYILAELLAALLACVIFSVVSGKHSF